MSDLKFICPNCEKELTKIIHKAKGTCTVLINFKIDGYKYLKLDDLEHIEFRCPECDIKILPPLENILIGQIRKERETDA